MQQRDIFIQAVQIEDAQQRSQYLDSACAGDQRLRQDLAELLAEHYRQTNFILDAPPPGIELIVDHAADSGAAHFVGMQVGPFRIREQIGEGGMGEVYVADQLAPVRRRVALKIIKAGMATRDTVARFEAERQALALMDHPHIARVFDGGLTETGQPYFVMELVRGLAITQYCDQAHLSIPDRLQLFVSVCRAIHHAHQKGIIHRDIKPTNVLVTEIDGEASPKVIDFGVAKAVNQQLSEQTVYTQFAQVIGTPQYMSPEQAGMGVIDVDTRSDVYSLGVMLYELLTGGTPFTLDSFKQASFDQWRNMLLEQEPERPSMRVTTLQAEAQSTVAERRRIGARRVSDCLRGELDWIVMKALEKDRSRRYDSAGALAADVERYLKDEPVLASPPSRWYRLSKSARKHRLALAAAGLVGLTLVVGTAVSIWQAQRAGIAERRAESRSQLARNVVDEMYTQVAEKWLDENDELTDIQRRFLEKALGYYQEFLIADQSSPQLRLEALRAQERVSGMQFRLGDHAHAETSLRRMITESASAMAEFPHNAEMRVAWVSAQTKLAELLRSTGRLVEADTCLEKAWLQLRDIKVEALPTRDLRAWCASVFDAVCLAAVEAGYSEAESISKRCLAVWQSLVREEPQSFEFRRGEAIALQLMGIEHARSGVDIGARSLFLQAERLLLPLLQAQPQDRASRLAYITTLGYLRRQVRPRLRDAIPAVDIDRRAIALAEGLVTQFPNHREYSALLARTYGHLAEDLQTRQAEGDLTEAIDVRRKQNALSKQLLDRFPQVAEYKLAFLTSCQMTAAALEQADRMDEKAALEEQTYQIVKAFAAQPEFDYQLASAIYRVAIRKAFEALSDDNYAAAAEILELVPRQLRRFDPDYPLEVKRLRQYQQEVVDHNGKVIAAWSGYNRRRDELPPELKLYEDYYIALLQIAEAFEQCAELAEEDRSLGAVRRVELVGNWRREVKDLNANAEAALDAWAEGAVAAEEMALLRQVEQRAESIEASTAQETTGLERLPREANVRMCRALINATLQQRPLRRQSCMAFSYLVAGPPEIRDPEALEAILQRRNEFLCNDQYDALWQRNLAWGLMRVGDWNGCLEALARTEDPQQDESIVAMCYWHLGEPEMAAHFLDEVHSQRVRLLTKRPKLPPGSFTLAPPASMLLRLHEEAQELIGPDKHRLIEAYYSQRHPDDFAFYEARGNWHQFHGRHQQAVTAFSEVARGFVAGRILRARAYSYCMLNERELARADIEAVLDQYMGNLESWFRCAPLAAVAGDDGYYQDFCQRFVSQFSQFESVVEQNQAAMIVLLKPNTFELKTLPREMFFIDQSSRRIHFGLPWEKGIGGLWEYRQGNPAAALEHLRVPERPDDLTLAKNYSVQAMAHHRLGQRAEASAALEQAAKALKQAEADVLIDVHFALQYAQILFREAEQVCAGH